MHMTDNERMRSWCDGVGGEFYTAAQKNTDKTRPVWFQSVTSPTTNGMLCTLIGETCQRL